MGVSQTRSAEYDSIRNRWLRITRRAAAHARLFAGEELPRYRTLAARPAQSPGIGAAVQYSPRIRFGGRSLPFDGSRRGTCDYTQFPALAGCLASHSMREAGAL